MQTVLYARVSTADRTSAHQETQARAAGFEVDRVIADEGVSGVSVAFAERPQARRLFDVLRRGDVLVVRWVDRLGRDYDDVTHTIRTFMKAGVVIRTLINDFTFDGATRDPVQKAVRDSLIAFMAATALGPGRGHADRAESGDRACPQRCGGGAQVSGPQTLLRPYRLRGGSSCLGAKAQRERDRPRGRSVASGRSKTAGTDRTAIREMLDALVDRA